MAQVSVLLTGDKAGFSQFEQVMQLGVDLFELLFCFWTHMDNSINV